MKKLLAFVLGLFVASTALATNTTMYPPVGGPFATQPVVVAASGNVYNPTTASSQSVPSSDVLPLMANGWTTINPNPVTSNLNFGALSMNGVPSAANSWLYSTSTITGTPTNPATGIARNSPMYFSYKDTVVYPYAGGGLFEQLYINDALTAGWDGFRGNELIYAVNAPPITGPNFYIFGSWTGTGTNGTYDVTFGIIGTNCTGTAPTGQIVVAGGVVTSVTDITAGTGCAIGDVLSFTVTGGSGTATLSNVPPSPGTKPRSRPQPRPSRRPAPPDPSAHPADGAGPGLAMAPSCRYRCRSRRSARAPCASAGIDVFRPAGCPIRDRPADHWPTPS